MGTVVFMRQLATTIQEDKEPTIEVHETSDGNYMLVFKYMEAAQVAYRQDAVNLANQIADLIQEQI